MLKIKDIWEAKYISHGAEGLGGKGGIQLRSRALAPELVKLCLRQRHGRTGLREDADANSGHGR